MKMPKCLLVDDDPAFLHLVAAYVRDSHLILCESAEAAIEHLRTQPIALLITDTNMPRMNGIELLTYVRSEPAWKSMPVVVLFGGLNGDAMTKADVAKLGATLVLTKDEFLSEAEKLVRNLLLG